MIIIWIIIAILMFMFIVIFHELWHFLTARFFWVKVEEFWIGFPPFAKKLFTDKMGTKYTLNWFPLWGFVKLKWENEKYNNPPQSSFNTKGGSKKDKFSQKSYFAKTVILLWGVFMNFLLAGIIFSILFFVWVKPIWINSQIKTNLDIKIFPTETQALKSGLLQQKKWIILYPLKNSLAEKFWIKKWDILLKINNKKIENPKKLIQFIRKNAWKKIIFLIKSENKIKSLQIKVWKNWKIWSYLSPNITINKDFKYKYWIIDSFKNWFLETYNQSLLTFQWIWMLWQKIFNPKNEKERQQAIKDMKWPIWIIDLVAHSFSAWISFILILSAIISINLWVFNLLPIPALDGWRWLLITINTFLKKIFGEKFNIDNFENLLHITFFIILIALSLIIWYNDTSNILNR